MLIFDILKTHPATWPSTNHGRQSVSIVRSRASIHCSIPIWGITMSWSPLQRESKIFNYSSPTSNYPTQNFN